MAYDAWMFLPILSALISIFPWKLFWKEKLSACSSCVQISPIKRRKYTTESSKKSIRLDLQWIYSRSSWTFNFNAQLSIFLSSLFSVSTNFILVHFSFFILFFSVIIKAVHNWIESFVDFLFSSFQFVTQFCFYLLSLSSCCIENLIEKIHSLGKCFSLVPIPAQKVI